jgi:hypothetical protein
MLPFCEERNEAVAVAALSMKETEAAVRTQEKLRAQLAEQRDMRDNMAESMVTKRAYDKVEKRAEGSQGAMIEAKRQLGVLRAENAAMHTRAEHAEHMQEQAESMRDTMASNTVPKRDHERLQVLLYCY